MIRIMQGLLIALILFLPTQLGKHFFPPFSLLSGVRIDYLAPTLYLTDSIAFLLIITNFKRIISFLKNIYVLFFVLLLIINAVVSLSPLAALYKDLKILEVLLLFGVLHQYLKNPASKFLSSSHILWSLVIGGGVELILAIIQFVTKHSAQGIFYFLGERYFSLTTPDIAKASIQGVEILRPYGTFSHPNSMAGFYVLLYFIVLTHPRFTSKTLLKYTFLLISTLLIFLTFSKTAIIAFVVLNIAYTILHRKDINCTFCVVARILMFTFIPLAFLIAGSDPLTIAKRVDLTYNALAIFAAHPFFGVGMGNYLVAQNDFPIKYPYFFLQPVHNIFLLFLTEAGVFLSLFVGERILHVFQTVKRSETFWFVVAVLVITGMFDHYWLTLQQNMLLLPFVFALL